MKDKPKPIPDGFHTATPYLIVRDAAAALEFYKKAFGATATECLREPSGKVMHAALKVGDSMIMIGQHQEVEARTSKALPRVSIHLYVTDSDAVARQTIAAGAKELYPVRDQFYGNREGGVEDPFGIVWWVSTHMEDVSPEELQKRVAAVSAHRTRVGVRLSNRPVSATRKL